MIAIAAMAASFGTYLLYSALVLGRRELILRRSGTRREHRIQGWMTQAGMVGVRPLELASVEVTVFVGSAVLAWIVFGALLPAVLAGLFGAAAPIAVYRARRRTLLDEARDAWPYLIEEMRLLTGALGRSIPVAMLEAGRKSPTAPMRAAFSNALRTCATQIVGTLASRRRWLTEATRHLRVTRPAALIPSAAISRPVSCNIASPTERGRVA